jgi:hypothetical protein
LLLLLLPIFMIQSQDDNGLFWECFNRYYAQTDGF